MLRWHRSGVLWAVVSLLFGWLAMAGLDAQTRPVQKSPRSSSAKQNASVPGEEKGVFKILVDGEPKGTEEFAITPQNGKIVARGKIHLAIARDEKPVEYLIETELQLQPNYDPIQYTLSQKFSGNTAAIKMNFTAGKAKVEFNTGSGTERREFDLAPDVTLLDDNIFHQYCLLVRRYNFDKGGLQEFSAFIPQESIGGILHMILKGDETVPVNNKPVTAQHLLVDTNDLKLDVYVTGSDHRLVKIVVPTANVVVERVE
ncbi:MAG: hypothetical protein PHX83_08485 [Acidobacteriia bacterium]|nr:hypothetical protein [Terriglobia bacterium]